MSYDVVGQHTMSSYVRSSIRHRMCDLRHRHGIEIHGPDIVRDNPFPNLKPIENVVLSAKWNVHIWTWLRCGCMVVHRGTGTLICQQISVQPWLPKTLNQFKFKWRRFAIGAFLKFLPIQSRNAPARLDAARRAPAPAHLPCKLSKLSKSSIRY